MRQLKEYINEKLHISNYKKSKYNYFPKTREELDQILKDLIQERGKDADLNDINVSKIKDMSYLFVNLRIRNINISEWDVSNVEDMKGMFHNCYEFNCDISDWDIRKVKNMTSMFYQCPKFEGKDLDNWKVSDDTKYNYIFYNCEAIKKMPDWWN